MEPSSDIPFGHEAVSMPGTRCSETVELLGAAALHLLSPAEQRVVDLHIAGCQTCAAELAELEEASALLAHAVPPVPLPEKLRARVLAAAVETPRHAEQLGAPRALGRFRRLNPAWLAAAACLVLSLGTAAWAIRLESQVAALGVKAARYDRIVGVLESERLLTRDLTPVTAGIRAYGSVYLDPRSGAGMVMVHDLPPVQSGRGWQLWYVGGADRVSGGMLRVGADGTGYSIVTVPRNLEEFQRLGITEEPVDGSPAPTTPRLMEATLQ